MNSKKIPLYRIAYARSGDKGNNANVGVIARSQQGYNFLEKALTTKMVKAHFQNLGLINVIRYELPNLLAFNFILEGALAGGGSRSLRIDSQGKALGQAMLELELDIPEELLSEDK